MSKVESQKSKRLTIVQKKSPIFIWALRALPISSAKAGRFRLNSGRAFRGARHLAAIPNAGISNAIKYLLAFNFSPFDKKTYIWRNER